MPSLPAVITPPTRLPKQPFVTEAQLAHLVRVTPETLRAWRRGGEMPDVAVGPERDEFCRSLKVHGRWPICYRISEVSAWLFGTGGPGGRPTPLPASAWDAANDQTMQLRFAAPAKPRKTPGMPSKRLAFAGYLHSAPSLQPGSASRRRPPTRIGSLVAPPRTSCRQRFAPLARPA